MNRNCLPVFFLILALCHLAASNVQSNRTSSQGTSAAKTTSKKSFAASTPQSYVSDKIVSLFKPKTGKELMEEKGKPPSAAAKTTVPGAKVPAAKTPQKGKTSVAPGYVPPPPPKGQPPQVNQVRQEVQKVLDLNKTIKNIQGDRVLQMQRIQEQARIHQKILDQLEAGKTAKKAQAMPDKDALLAQEKLRIINEETKRNQAVISGAGVSGSIVQVKEASKPAGQLEFKKPGAIITPIPPDKTAKTD